LLGKFAKSYQSNVAPICPADHADIAGGNLGGHQLADCLALGITNLAARELQDVLERLLRLQTTVVVDPARGKARTATAWKCEAHLRKPCLRGVHGELETVRPIAARNHDNNRSAFRVAGLGRINNVDGDAFTWRRLRRHEGADRLLRYHRWYFERC